MAWEHFILTGFCSTGGQGIDEGLHLSRVQLWNPFSKPELSLKTGAVIA